MVNKFLFVNKVRNRFAKIDEEGERALTDKLQQRFKHLEELYAIKKESITKRHESVMRKFKEIQKAIEKVEE